jgi:hypothetical protein
MAWIKRNLFFVISVVIGLGLTGYCGYLLYTALSANASLAGDYDTAKQNWDQIQQKSPYPSKENIDKAKTDEERVGKFMSDFRKRFESFPAPPPKDEKGFKTYLDDQLVKFHKETDDAGVELPQDFSFAFAGLVGRLTYPAGNLEPWMEQMQEISAMLDILCQAKINYLAELDRVPVGPDDQGFGLQDVSVTNQWGVVTPYKIVFRGFSAELSAVLEGFAKSSHCFIVKSIVIAQDTTVGSATSPYPMNNAPAAMPYAAQQQYIAPPTYAPQMQRPGMARRPEFGGPPGRPPVFRPTQPVYMPSATTASAASAPTTILSEDPLLITMSIELIKLKEAGR